MNKITEEISVSVQTYPTATTGISGSAVVEMDKFSNAVVRAFAHKLPDQKGEGVLTLSLYETTGTVLNGSQVAASIVTGSITSVSDVVLASEIKGYDFTEGYKNIYARVASSTATVVSVIIERGKARYNEV